MTTHPLIHHIYTLSLHDALPISQQAMQNSLLINDTRGEAIEYMNFAITYLDMNNPDSASYYAEKGVLMISYMEDLGGEVYRVLDRKSTRLNSSHLVISYAVFCLK